MVVEQRLLGHNNKQLGKSSTIYSLATQGTIKIVLGAVQLIDTWESANKYPTNKK